MSEMKLVEAVKDGNTETVTELIESGTGLNEQDKQGWTPLNWAAGKGNLEMVELLLQHGADPFAVGRDLRTPQMIALAAGHAEVVKLLRHAEARIKGGETGQSDRKYCVAYHLVDLRRYSGWTERETNGDAGEQSGEEDETADIVFLHQDYSVTKSIWPDEDIIFNEVTEQWKDFCTTELGFVIPDSLDLITQAANPAS